MLSAQNISVTLGTRPVLQDVELHALTSQVTAIFGPNASGKSTFLKALSGDLAYTGSVSLNGIGVETLKPWELALMRAVLPQSSTLAFPFPVIDLVSI